MKDSKDILHQIEQKIAQSPNNLPTAAGHPETGAHTKVDSDDKALFIDAINQAFELLRINYHHLYFSAYSEIDALNAAKRLWLDALGHFSPAIILQATSEVIKHSDFLPTISKMLVQCQTLSDGALPDARTAYIEACQAPSPKQNYRWSHPAVYYAGKACDWFFLTSNSEKIAFPVFNKHYDLLRMRVMNGEQLPAIRQLALADTTETPLDKTENAKRLQQLRAQLDL